MSRPSPTERRELQTLLALFAFVTVWSAIKPYDIADYLLELATPLGGAILLVVTARWHRFTPLAYRLMFLEGLVLLVGAHYTHQRVPLFDWLREPMGWERNHYDRFAHFAVGFLLAIPFRELIVRFAGARGRAASVLAAVAVMALACVYEITEWWIAAVASPEVGAAYLGSQGDVWDAQKDMDTLTEGQEKEELLTRVIREAKAAGRLNHPNIITIYDVIRDKDLTYIIMQYIDGQSLQALIDSGKSFSPQEIIQTLKPVSEALDFAHQNGIVHRDIKPANILIDKSGQPFLADFGVARIETSTLTQAGTTVGTLSYMSPEQVKGQMVDKRSDIFALGVILYELLTGKKPFGGDNMSTIV